MKRILLSVLAAGLIAVAHAQVPGTLSYQGILVDNVGAPVADGTHFVKFDFYNALTGGVAVYSSTGTGSGNSVTTYKGMFTFIIGSGSIGNTAIPAGIWSSQLFIEVTADLVVLAPRVQITSNAYSFKAENSNSIVDNAVTSAKIADGAIVGADLGTGSVNSAKILDGEIVNTDISASAGIVDTKLATISTANKVAGSAIFGAMSGTLSAANITGQVAVASGGTGSTTQAGARTNLGLGSISTLSAIGSTEITDLSIATADLAAGAVTGAKILDGTIDNADISASAAIADSKLATITTAGKVSGNAITSGTISGSLIGTGISATNVTTGTLPASVIPASVASGSGSGGQVGFWNGSNTLTGNAGLFWDNTNFRLGLGTIAPNRRLHLVGTGALDDDIVIEANAAASNAGAIRFVRSQGSFSTPTSALANDQLGSVTFAGYNGTSYTNSAEVFSNAETLFSTSASAYLGFSTASAGTLSEKMRITSAGTVGIGTTTPAAGLRLDVNGSSIFRGYTGINRSTTLGGFSLFDIEGPGGASTYLGMNINGTNASSFPFYGYATAGIQRAWTYYDGSTLTWKLNMGGTDRLTVSASGNLGIGTSPNASTKLDVEGGAVIGSTYAGTNAAPTNGLLVEGNVGFGTTTATYPITLFNSTDARVVNIEQDYAGASVQYGMTIDMTSATGTSSKYGIDCNVSGTAASSSSVYGLETDIILNGSGTAFGVNSSISSTGTGTGSRYGVYSVVSSGTTAGNTGTICGVLGFGISNSLNSTGPVYGIYGQTTDGGGTGTHYAGYFSGDVAYTGTITDVSDRRLKKNIQPMPGMLSKLMQLKPSTFLYRSDEYKFMSLPTESQLGLIAQEVETLFPEAVTDNTHPGEMDSEGKTIGAPFDYKGVDYTVMIPVLIKGMQEQQVQIEELKSTISKLKGQINEFENITAQVEELKKMISGKSDEKLSGAVSIGSDKK